MNQVVRMGVLSSVIHSIICEVHVERGMPNVIQKIMTHSHIKLVFYVTIYKHFSPPGPCSQNSEREDGISSTQ